MTAHNQVRDLALGLLVAALAWVGPAVALRWARPALLNFGPNDADYVRGFRADWELDGRTRFHWTTRSATVSLPLYLRGGGFLLRLRARRHFVEPAHVRLTSEGRTVGLFELAADPRVAYRVIEVSLPRLEGREPFTLLIDSASENPRPLGIALDWMELERRGPSAAFKLSTSARFSILLAVTVLFLVPRLAGLPSAWAFVSACALALGASLGTAWDVIAAERIVRQGAPAFAAVALATLVLVRWLRSAGFLGTGTRVSAGILTLVVLLALAIRLTLLLHPQFYYPDVKVHGLFAWHLAKDGAKAFLRDFTAHQFRLSLGLQMENGHWYAFPYPPAFYFLCWPLLRFARYRPEVAVSVLAAVVNSLEALVVFALARRLGRTTRTALGAALALSLLPIFLARLTLAYFPALVGHALDAVVILFLLSRLADLDRPRVVLGLGALLAIALLTYTQSLLNFGLLLPLFLLLQALLDRAPGAWRRSAGLAAAGVLGAVLALVVFYGRYVPVFLDMRRGVPMAEEHVLLDKPRAPNAPELPPEEPNDPYAGPGLDLWRGVQKAGSRLLIFYGWFAPLVVAGVVLAARRLEPQAARFAAAWAATYLLLNLASGGLPGPNLFRYNKDLEIVAPLCCVGLATLGFWLWDRGRAWRLPALAYAASFTAFGAARAVRYLTETFVLER